MRREVGREREREAEGGRRRRRWRNVGNEQSSWSVWTAIEIWQKNNMTQLLYIDYLLLYRQADCTLDILIVNNKDRYCCHKNGTTFRSSFLIAYIYLHVWHIASAQVVYCAWIALMLAKPLSFALWRFGTCIHISQTWQSQNQTKRSTGGCIQRTSIQWSSS